jgi:hypothetical protein
MPRPTPTPSTLLLIILAGYVLFTRAEDQVPFCFYPDGSQAQGDYACNLTASTSFCCAIGYYCLDNKICVNSAPSDSEDDVGNQLKYNRGSCTDRTWRSPDCP